MRLTVRIKFSNILKKACTTSPDVRQPTITQNQWEKCFLILGENDYSCFSFGCVAFLSFVKLNPLNCLWVSLSDSSTDIWSKTARGDGGLCVCVCVGGGGCACFLWFSTNKNIERSVKRCKKDTIYEKFNDQASN